MMTHPGQIEVESLATELDATGFPENLPTFCATQAEKYGDAIAIDYFQDGVQLSYRALHQRSNRVAANLLKRGYRKGAHIAVMLPNGPASVLIWFAIMKIGAVIVPVNTAYRGKELDFILNQSDAQALIMGDQFQEAFREMKACPDLLSDPIVVLSGELGGLENGGELVNFDPGYPVIATDLANLQYTSGTTGFPKGCMLAQDYWLVLSHSIAQVHNHYGNTRLFFWAPFFYMDGQWSFLSAMATGGTAIIASKMSLTKFLGWMHEQDAHYCVLPEPILKAVPPTTEDAKIPLKFVHAFGWRPSARAEAEARFTLVARDSFGMTEVGPAIICPEASGEKLEQNTCGVAAPYRETRVVDENGAECAPGEPGELQIRGRGIMLGYYKRPDANADNFDGDWFRSGDLFVKDADGYHRIVGRLKEMIKRAGENISATEIEAAMREATEIAEAAAISVPDEMRREEVMVVLKLADGFGEDDFTAERLLDHSTRLAAFKRPRYFAFVEEFPRTATNKIAKKQLSVTHLTGSVFDCESMKSVEATKARNLIGR
ncbi:long-chain fatty acid--CoA ligase [Phaeobacter gallaeciensis]|uniref:Long-chain fatty acid--CoA ligase n=2 Tax=Roseobacteraceae TaxID=2854170 RepID=A0A366X7P5_9RHOB|nr:MULTISPECIES: class I adenylate-forming enzyme family protein [Roseobacteraceae]MBT3143205.1 acyl--CoA ligase [Falsiruegeria litorea]MBT8167616.1 acyl--CoA ligase [Falsiruegeria litorea]RBW57995.1 long-chain fatty acid--CoA ligase [Phaeobacter gallaeciensis]